MRPEEANAGVFRGGELRLEDFAAAVRPFLLELVGVRVAVRAERLSAIHLLIALGRRARGDFEAALASKLLHGQTPAGLLADLCNNLGAMARGPVGPASLARSSFTEEGAALLEELARQLPATAPSVAGAELVQTLLRQACRYLTRSEKELLKHALDTNALASAAGAALDEPSSAGPAPRPQEDAWNSAAYSREAQELLQEALAFAARTGHTECFPSHLALACTASRADLLQRVFNVCGDGAMLAATRQNLLTRLARGRPAEPLRLQGDSFARASHIILELAAAHEVVIGEPGILRALLERLDLDPVLRSELRDGPLQLDVGGAISFLQRAGSWNSEARASEGPRIPRELGEVERLSETLAGIEPERWVSRPELEELGRAVFSPTARVVIVHGEQGVGCTGLVECLVSRAARGGYPFLSGVAFVRIDAAKLSESALRGLPNRLRSGLAAADLVVVLEAVERLVEVDANALRQLSTVPGAGRLLGVTTTAAFRRIVGADQALADRLWAVQVAEADRETAEKILCAVASDLEREFAPAVKIQREILPAIVRWSDAHPEAARQPARAVRLLRFACEEAAFSAVGRPAGRASVDRDAVARFLARKTGLPAERVLGRDSEAFYREELSRRVFGQPAAVARVARGLALARGGARRRPRPAGALLFVGPPGPGKTLFGTEGAARE